MLDTSPSPIAISIQNACKTYQSNKKELRALDDVSFDIHQGDFFGLLGPNGAGKTTLISAMAGLSRLDAGHIKIMGFDIATQTLKAKQKLGIVPQELVFDPFFNVRESLNFQARYYGVISKDGWIDEILHHLNLTDKASTNTRRLSGGMKRRLMVAMALVHRPEVIVLDEPTAGVDVELRQNMWEFIKSLNKKGHTILLTTHYLEEAQSLCNKVALMQRGKLITLGATHTLLQQFSGLQLKIKVSHLLPEFDAIKIKEMGDYFILKLDHYEQIAHIIQSYMQANIKIDAMDIMQADLEHVFLQLTSE